jgi:SAM-dependent methyltransferase
VYSGGLERAFTYRNTYLHRDPVLDLTRPDEQEFGRYDFVICSEVLEHVAPPVERAFETLSRLLTPGGVLVLTAPYSVGPETLEHYPHLGQFALVEIEGRTVLVTRSVAGGYEVIDNLSFHGGPGSTLEMRLFSETDLRARLLAAGLADVRIGLEESAAQGIVFSSPCSLPIVASRAGFSLPPAAIMEVAEQLATDRRKLEMIRTSRWMALGRRLHAGPRLDETRYIRGK